MCESVSSLISSMSAPRVLHFSAFILSEVVWNNVSFVYTMTDNVIYETVNTHVYVEGFIYIRKSLAVPESCPETT